MTSSKIAAAIAVGLVLAAGPATAIVLDGKTKVKSSESIGPAAAGDPKPYSARAGSECSGSVCTFNFGKKGNKARTIEWINCGINVSTGAVRIGAVIINDFSDQAGYFSKVSSVVDGGDETAVLEYRNPVTVPAGALLFVYLVTTGTPGSGQCTLGGTIG
jgi:hypothetical protein